ncbi:YihY/virulence factor BrkB family protein [Streptosporangium saharense]|uniref:YihY/virulence factor BrkB family protein n=1 Tax=Streptosporangium saharense TaxID=1706840 RepID=UPI0033341B71
MTVMSFTGRLSGRITEAWVRARRRHGWLDHLARAAVRYDQVDGGRLSAALTYYSFFAIFALGLLGFAIIGHVLDTPEVVRAVQEYLSETFPRLDVAALREAQSTAGLIAFFGLPLTGLFWIDTLRSAIRAIWHLEQYPGVLLLRQLIDLGVLAGLGLLLSLTLTLAFVTGEMLSWLVAHTVGTDDAPAQWLLSAAAFVVGLGVNTLLAFALLSGPPRLRLPPRRALVPALLITVGLEILKTLGQLYIGMTAANPAYQVVAGAAAMLVFLKLLNQLVLFAAALTATGRNGRVVDLTTGRTVPPVVPATVPSPAAVPLAASQERDVTGAS